jgi:small subunit ribosomal protein S6
MENTAKRQYEMMLILSSEMGETERNKEIEDIKKMLAKNAATIANEDVWGVRDLAYRIKKEDQGFYIVWILELSTGETLKEINKLLTLNQMVIRHMITTCPKNYEFRTSAEYEKAAEKAALEVAKEEKEKGADRRPAKVVEKKEETKKVVKKEKVVEKKEEAVKETVEKVEVVEEKPAAKTEKEEKEEKVKLDEVDEKLKSLIDDPDISL